MNMQYAGIVIAVVAAAGLLYWVWITYLKPATTTPVTPTPVTPVTPVTPTPASVIATMIASSNLTTNLGYVELLSKIDAVAASPDATKACGVIADVLWQNIIQSWKTAQTPTTDPVVPALKTAKVTTTDGAVVEVPVQ